MINLSLYSVKKAFSYTVSEDNGYSPNPFWGSLTLPWCKPLMRKAIATYMQKNKENIDYIWLVGITRKDGNGYNRILYIAKIDHILTHHDYFNQYPEKRPNLNQEQHIFKIGDNCYVRDADSTYEHTEIPNVHSNNSFMKERSLSAPYVLISKHFVYYGQKAPILPDLLAELKVGQGFKSNISEATLDYLSKFISKVLMQDSQLIFSHPHVWPSNDSSWQQSKT